MPTMRDIKGRIRSVSTTKKTTKAMNLVSSSKMAKARGVLNAANPYFAHMRRAIGDILHASPDFEHPVFEGNRKLQKALIVVIANDRGLCGGYNVNVSKLAANLAVSLSDEGKEVSFLTIGNKARDFLRRAGGNIVEHFSGISEKPTIEDAREIMPLIMKLYNLGEVDEVYIAYTEFKSAITYIPKSLRILPVSTDDFPLEEGRKYGQMKFEPSADEVLSYIVPKFLGTTLFECLITAAASGQGATMTAMDSATENAENIIDNLTLILNRVRQAAITQEISEIVGGANALE
ncbi:MAG: ATP synthase F1 subunit gamma [Clostridiales bacterium]|jgi:F-type H+-transporting ATPase subunit gamma|nr:ATP synthase F1 subunit gamma [Clostridiales bacterium]